MASSLILGTLLGMLLVLMACDSGREDSVFDTVEHWCPNGGVKLGLPGTPFDVPSTGANWQMLILNADGQNTVIQSPVPGQSYVPTSEDEIDYAILCQDPPIPTTLFTLPPTTATTSPPTFPPLTTLPPTTPPPLPEPPPPPAPRPLPTTPPPPTPPPTPEPPPPPTLPPTNPPTIPPTPAPTTPPTVILVSPSTDITLASVHGRGREDHPKPKQERNRRDD